MKHAGLYVVGIMLGALIVCPSSAAVLCKKKSGAVFLRNTCKPKEQMVDLSTVGEPGPGGPPGPSDGDGARTDHTSGTRLRVRYVAGSDGSRVFEGFFDTQRQENCTFNSRLVRAGDGTIRCLPSERLTYQSNFYFQDPSCLQRIAAALKTECPPVYAASYSTDRCPLTMTVYRLDAPFALPEGGTLYYLNSSAQCVAYPGTSFLVQSNDLYVVGGEIFPSNFVEGSSAVE